jgi:8-oxo-dGTP pyrophosphatase MutT (NUDIX family)
VTETSQRRAARVLCLDAADRLLLLRWRDPFDGALLWEPPGGGVETGETPLEAARRELVEETGLEPSAVLGRWVPVRRDVRWRGHRHIGTEHFFLARFPEDRPPVEPAGLLARERATLQGHAWMAPQDLAALPDRLEPPEVAAVLAALTGGRAPGQRPA